MTLSMALSLRAAESKPPVITNSASARGSPLTQVPPAIGGCMLGTPPPSAW